MPETTNYALPYPTNDGEVRSGATNIQALATAIESNVGAAVMGTKPWTTSPGTYTITMVKNGAWNTISGATFSFTARKGSVYLFYAQCRMAHLGDDGSTAFARLGVWANSTMVGQTGVAMQPKAVAGWSDGETQSVHVLNFWTATASGPVQVYTKYVASNGTAAINNSINMDAPFTTAVRI